MFLAVAAFITGICLRARNQYGDYNALVYTQSYDPAELWACIGSTNAHDVWDCVDKWESKLTESYDSGTWTCPGSVLPVQIYFNNLGNFPCRGLISVCSTDSALAANASGLGFQCPGSQLSGIDIEFLNSFCALVGIGQPIVLTAPPFMLSKSQLRSYTRVALGMQLSKLTDSILAASLLDLHGRADDDTYETFGYATLAVLSLQTVFDFTYDAHIPSHPVLDSLGWFGPLLGVSSLPKDLAHLPLEVHSICQDMGVKHRMSNVSLCYERNLQLSYFAYLQEVRKGLYSGTGQTNIHSVCTRTKQKSVWHRIVEWAAVLGGLLSLVFVTVLPKVWNWVLMPSGRCVGLWRDCPVEIGEIERLEGRKLSRSQSVV